MQVNIDWNHLNFIGYWLIFNDAAIAIAIAMTMATTTIDTIQKYQNTQPPLRT